MDCFSSSQSVVWIVSLVSQLCGLFLFFSASCVDCFSSQSVVWIVSLLLSWHPFVLSRHWLASWWLTLCCALPGVTQEPHSDTAVSVTLAAGETVG